MKNMLFTLVMLSFALAACSSGTASPAPLDVSDPSSGTASPVPLDVSDPAKTIEAAAGSEFKIVLESNATTGFHWALVDQLDESIVQFVSNDYKSVGTPMPGSGGMEIWTFKAVSAGEAKITLGYYPPSNEPTDPQQSLTFIVNIK